jgi:hypothetical protein
MKVFAREMLWLLMAALMAVPLGYFFVFLMNLTPDIDKISQNESVFQMEFFFIGAILGFVGVYMMRVVIWAIITVVKKMNNAA